ncbi:MAG: sigma factor-like helix-turn-helix DNA-binding protein [Erysipelotrichia bacterium]|nr:sigma factor-like helix-turn-helix DNA-binding protein [Erysipelotrichia bacterium]
MDDFEYINELLPFYLTLLTDKQQQIVQLYYYENYSLSEIAENLDISRNAVYDTLKKSTVIIKKYEDKLQLKRNFQIRMDCYKKLLSLGNKRVDEIVSELINMED